MMQPLVSVVMPSMNQAGFIEAAIRSVLDQDYRNVELLVVDGGSTDSTLQRLESMLAAYGPRLRWVSEQDSGPANAINKALRVAGGDILGWLNSDDLYAPGAVSRAVTYLASNREMLMVYGEAEHIDAHGLSLGRYPTQPPSAGIEAFHDGCFVCQPTVFTRKPLFRQIGFLDEKLRTAFDFDLWLRCFRMLPQRIGYIDHVQAFSRLHDGSITLRQRRQVAIEGAGLLAKYVGPPKPHWFWTYLAESCATYPLVGTGTDIHADIKSFLEQAERLFDAATMSSITTSLAQDARLRIALPDVFADIYPDGWASPSLKVRIRRPPSSPASRLRLQCVHEAPVGRRLEMDIHTSWGTAQTLKVAGPGPFDIFLDIPEVRAGDGLVALIHSKSSFVPQMVEAGSLDTRQLAFKVKSMQWENSR